MEGCTKVNRKGQDKYSAVGQRFGGWWYSLSGQRSLRVLPIQGIHAAIGLHKVEKPARQCRHAARQGRN